MKLNEEQENEVCYCEDCGYKPLKHFEECPNCLSRAYHLAIKEPKKKKDEN